MASDDKKNWQRNDRADERAAKAAKGELEKLFSNSKVSKDKKAKLEAIRAKRGTPDYYKLIAGYCEEFGLPHEWDAQVLVLDHKDTSLVIQLLEQLKATGPKLQIEQQKLLIQKLKVMEVSTFDSQLIHKIKEVKAALLVT